MLNFFWLWVIWPEDSMPVTRWGQGAGPAETWTSFPSTCPRAAHQAGPEEVAGAKAPLPGQRAEESVPQRPTEQHRAAVEGELGLLQVAGEGSLS